MVTDIKQWLCLRWKPFGGYYYVGPFADSHDAAEWADDNQGIDICWEVGNLDPNVALEIRAPGDMPELQPDPKYPDRWTERQANIGDFYLLMIYSDPLHLVGPFPDHRHAFSWAVAYQARADDEGWQVLWLEDPTAPAPLLTPAEGVAEGARRDEAWRRVARQSEWWQAALRMGIDLDVAEQRREQEE